MVTLLYTILYYDVKKLKEYKLRYYKNQVGAGCYTVKKQRNCV